VVRRHARAAIGPHEGETGGHPWRARARCALDNVSVGRRRWIGAALGVGLVLCGLVIANVDLVRGDTYCGSPFSDAKWGAVCDVPLRSAGLAAGILTALGLGSLFAAVSAGRSGRDRTLARAAFGLGLVGFALVLVSANRLVEPIDDPFCGSVVNRHRYHDAARESRCDAALEPFVEQAMVSASLGAAVLGGAVAVERARRSHRRGGIGPRLHHPDPPEAIGSEHRRPSQ
jgi:hypothetical protein